MNTTAKQQLLPHTSKPKDCRPPLTIKELPQQEEEDQNESAKKDLDQEEVDDDHINESLFERYDQMFGLYNNFGALFQDTAHYIGLLIRKNMLLNSKIEDIAQSHTEIKL